MGLRVLVTVFIYSNGIEGVSICHCVHLLIYQVCTWDESDLVPDTKGMKPAKSSQSHLQALNVIVIVCTWPTASQGPISYTSKS